MHRTVRELLEKVLQRVPDMTDEQWTTEHDRRLSEESQRSAAAWENVAVLAELIRHQR